jgi:hypothetical protein
VIQKTTSRTENLLFDRIYRINGIGKPNPKEPLTLNPENPVNPVQKRL